jgi:hypothetical protein
MREKLIELLKQTPIAKINGHIAEAEVCFVSHVFESFADHLIANDVTVQQWIPVTERLPENICPVLVALEGLSTAFNGWYQDGKWWTVGAGTRPFTQKVTHWMPLPQPPKEG